MTFVEALNFYFTVVLEFTNFFAYFCLALSFVIMTLPKNNKDINRKSILFEICLFLGIYASSVILGSFFFAISNAVIKSNILFNLFIPIVVCVCGIIFSKGKAIHRFIKVCVMVSSAMVIEVLSKTSGYFFGLAVSSDNFIIHITRASPYILGPIMALVLHKVDIARYEHLSAEMVTIISTLTAVLLGVGLFEHIEFIEDMTTNVILMVLDLALLFILTFSYYATYKNIENRHKITNLEVQKTLEEAERMSIAIDEKNREELHKLRHDIKNQASYLSILIQQGKNEEALNYINEFMAGSEEALTSFSCSNNVINSIINLELTKAKIKGIKMDIKVVIPPMLPFKDSDLVSLITNMIDNALENYKSDNNDPITIRILKQNDFVRFFISNPTDVEKLKTGSLTSTRKSGRGHGYGTKIIKNIASTYNGFVEFSVEGDRFLCDAVLDINKKG